MARYPWFPRSVILGYRDGFRSITAPETVTMTVSTPRSIVDRLKVQNAKIPGVDFEQPEGINALPKSKL